MMDVYLVMEHEDSYHAPIALSVHKTLDGAASVIKAKQDSDDGDWYYYSIKTMSLEP